MNIYITPDDVIAVIKSFLSCIKSNNETDSALILTIGAELLDVSIDKLLEMLEEEN